VDLLLHPEDLAFRAEVRSFLADHVAPGMRRAIDLTTGFLIDPDVLRELHRALHRKGWSVPHWPLEHGGTGWSPVKRYIFDLECGSAGAAAYNASGSHFSSVRSSSATARRRSSRSICRASVRARTIGRKAIPNRAPAPISPR